MSPRAGKLDDRTPYVICRLIFFADEFQEKTLLNVRAYVSHHTRGALGSVPIVTLVTHGQDLKDALQIIIDDIGKWCSE